MLTTNFPFTTPGNYAYDASVIEVSGGVAKLKDLVPADETFYANYNDNINGSRGGGDLTGIAFGGAAVVGGELDLAHDDKRYVTYDANLNADSPQVGCVRFKYIPNYNGASSTEQGIFHISQGLNYTNLIYLRHRVGGAGGHYIVLHLYDENGALIREALVDFFVAVQGQVYEFEVNWDLTTGESRFFKDGVQPASTVTVTGTRSSDINILRIGSNGGGSYDSNFKIDDFQVFSTVQHTADYTPDSCVGYKYCITNPAISPATIVYADALGPITVVDTVIASDALRYALEIEGVAKYHNGTEWVASSGYAESNTLDDLNDNSASLDLTLGATIKPIIYLHSDAGETTPEIDTLTLEYNFFTPSTVKPDTCVVWGYVLDMNNAVVADAIINVKFVKKYDLENDAFIISYTPQSVTTNINGYFEIELIRSSEFTEEGYYNFNIVYDADTNKKFSNRIVPDEDSKNFWEILNA